MATAIFLYVLTIYVKVFYVNQLIQIQFKAYLCKSGVNLLNPKKQYGAELV